MGKQHSLKIGGKAREWIAPSRDIDADELFVVENVAKAASEAADQFDCAVVELTLICLGRAESALGKVSRKTP